jgi:hypothetical protein
VDSVLLQHDALAVDQVRIGQIHEKRGVVVADIRAEQQWRPVVEQQFQTRQVPRIFVEQTGGANERCADVAANVEDDKRIAVFERLRRAGRLCRGNGES